MSDREPNFKRQSNDKIYTVVMKWSVLALSVIQIRNLYKPQGSTHHIRIWGGQSKKFSGNQKMYLQLYGKPIISAHFVVGNQYMNIKYPETMPIEVRIASTEPKNISSTMFGVKKYHEHGFSFIWTQKYHFWQCPDPKISDLPPRMCMC